MKSKQNSEDDITLTALFIEALELPDDTPKQDLLNLRRGLDAQWDSIRHVFLLNQIEKRFNIRFDVADAVNIRSFADTTTAVAKKLASSEN
ncbi:MAG: acyl carrier protein [Bdellovibrionales bacterium]|nr:acyl carrier protein [Bdellovibrionales bacterium]